MSKNILAKMFIICLLFLMVFTDPVSSNSIIHNNIEYRLITKNNDLAVYFNEKDCSLIIKNEKSRSMWTSFVENKNPGYIDANVFWQSQMQSLLTFSYYDKNNNIGSNINTSLAAQKKQVVYRYEDNSIEINFHFPDLELGFSVELKLQENRLSFSIPFSSVYENGTYGLVAVQPLPFLGAADETDKGYFVLPDGSGALYRFKNTLGNYSSEYGRIIKHVYSPEEVSIQKYAENDTENYKNVFIPAFGVKKNQNAFTSLVTQGQENTSINFAQSGFAINLNRVSFELHYRHRYELFLSEIGVQGRSTAEIKPTRFDLNLIPGDRTVQYFFLDSDDADYSGMARTLRKFYIDTDVLPKNNLSQKIPLSLSLLGGVTEQRLFMDKYVSMTTFNQASNIIHEFLDAGVKSLFVNILGWTRGGYGTWPKNWPPSRYLGGGKGLKNLSSITQEKDVSIFLQANFVDALKINRGFNIREDTVKQGNTLSVTDVLKEQYILNPHFAKEELYSFIKNISENSTVSGVTFEQIGRKLYQDYHGSYPHHRRDTLETWKTMAEKSSEILGSAALYGGMIELLKYADILYEIPMEGSNYITLDSEIPFYQMVIHGSVYYTSVPGNLFYDNKKQFLRWIEYGNIPNYILTYKSSELLRDTDFNHLFTSHYKDWVQPISEVWNEFNNNFASFYNLPMIDHQYIDDNVVRITFENGTMVYLNYRDQEFKKDSVEIAPMDYAIKMGNVPSSGAE